MELTAAEGREVTIDEVIVVVASVVHTVLLVLVGYSVVHTGVKLEVINIGGNASPF